MTSGRFVAAVGKKDHLDFLHTISDVDAERCCDDFGVGKAELADGLAFRNSLLAGDDVDRANGTLRQIAGNKMVAEERLANKFSCTGSAQCGGDAVADEGDRVASDGENDGGGLILGVVFSNPTSPTIADYPWVASELVLGVAVLATFWQHLQCFVQQGFAPYCAISSGS